MKNEPTNLRMALALAEKGLRVFPCKPKSKVPATEHGCLDASSDPKVVRRMFLKKADLNVAIATGRGSGVWALDADGKAGRMAVAALEHEHGELPHRGTIKVFTPGGGFHLYFSTNGSEIRNRTKINGGCDPELCQC